jgi:putative ABC transport system permease protein
VRFVIAIAGVGFAVVLILMQIGFQDALFESAVTLHERLKADIVLINPHWSILPLPKTFPRRRLYQARGFEGVDSVSPVYTAVVRWQNHVDKTTREIFMIGVNPAHDALDLPEMERGREIIRYPDAVLYDEASRPEYGPVAAAFRARGELGTEVNQHRVAVRGLFQLGTSFGVDGTIITSDANFWRIFPLRSPGAPSVGLVRLAPGADPIAVRDALAAALPNDVQVLTRDQFVARDIRYWATATPIGYVFTFGVIMGLVVGAIIVYQILFADIADHLPEYATLKAMGYTNRYLAAVVLTEALLLAVIGFLPALGVSAWLFQITRSATMLPLQITLARTLLVLGLTIGMCWVSGLIAMRKLRSADPAEVF